MIHGDRHHDRLLHANIVAEPQNVHASFRKLPGTKTGHVCHLVQQIGRHGIFTAHIDKEVVHTAQIPGGLPDRALRPDKDRVPLLLDRRHLRLQVGVVQVCKIGPWILFEILNSCGILERMVHARHVMGAGSSFVRDTPAVKFDLMREAFGVIRLEDVDVTVGYAVDLIEVPRKARIENDAVGGSELLEVIPFGFGIAPIELLHQRGAEVHADRDGFIACTAIETQQVFTWCHKLFSRNNGVYNKACLLLMQINSRLISQICKDSAGKGFRRLERGEALNYTTKLDFV